MLLCDPPGFGGGVQRGAEPAFVRQLSGRGGQSAPLYRMEERLLRQTAELIARCECQDGCPSCVGAPGEAGERGKAATRILGELL